MFTGRPSARTTRCRRISLTGHTRSFLATAQGRWMKRKKRIGYEKSGDHASSCSPQKSAGYSRVGLLAWRLQLLPASPLYLPQPSAEWYFKAAFLTYSGGTAPALHRTSLLCPDGHPRQFRYTTTIFGGCQAEVIPKRRPLNQND